MSTRNNNQTAVKDLARAYNRYNRQQNRILVLAAAMSVFLLYTAFSIAYGKIRSDYLIDLRGMGTAANVSLENGSQKQYEQMIQFSWLSAVGIEKSAGTGTISERWEGELVYLDQDAWEKMIVPAYTDVNGTYPKEKNEIMLSRETLDQMKIDDPEIGMRIQMKTILADGTEETVTFLLSGYYTDYLDTSVTGPHAYISEQFLKEHDIPVFPADKIMAVSSATEDGEGMETKLYSSLDMEYDSQQVFGENPMVKQSIEGVFGSISIAAGCGILVLLCAFLLIYNVVSITLGKEIHQYGLLKVLGATESQLRSIALYQSVWSTVKGIAAGALAGGLIVRLFLPAALEKLFMEGLGKNDTKGWYPLLLAGAAGLVFTASLMASGLSVCKVIRWSAMDSVRYIETGNTWKEKQSRLNRMLFLEMAWRNITRSKKRLTVSIGALLTGCITFLSVVVIMTGTDLTNQIEKNPDFEIGILTGIFRFPELVPEKINDNTPVLPDSLMKTLGEIKEIDTGTIQTVQGSYAVIDFQNCKALEPRLRSMKETKRGQDFATIQIVDDTFVSELERYAVSHGLAVDMRCFQAGEGCILLHHNELSQTLESQAAQIVGDPVAFYSLDSYGKAEQMEHYEKGTAVCAGYLDMTAKGFPELQTTSLGNQINYFIMTEETFEKLDFPKKTFDISFDIKAGEDDVLVDQKLSRLIQKENKDSGTMDTFYLNANYTLLESEQNRIQTADILLGGLSASILAIGILNYGNTLFSAFAVRRREFAIMQSLGLTRGQLWRLIFLEGLCYWGLVMTATGTVGSGIIWILGRAVKAKLLYFRFDYPWEAVGLLAVMLLGICILFSGAVYYFGSRNLAEELRKND